MAKEEFDMYTLPQEPSSMARLLDASFRLFSAGFVKVIGIGLMLAASYIAFAFMTNHIMGVPPDGSEISPEGFKHNLAAFFVAVFGFTMFTFLFYGAIIYRFDNITHQRQDTLVDALGVGMKKLPSMLVATILYTLAIAIGMLLLVVPGIILGLSLSFYWIFITVENLGGYASLKASHKLVWGLWWRTLSVYMVPGILMIIFYVLAGMIGYGLSDETATPGTFGAADIVTNLMTGLVMPYFSALAYVVFNDLKLRKSGDDLARRLSR